MGTLSTVVKALIPKHEIKKLAVFNDIAKKEIMNYVDGKTRSEAKKVLEEVNTVYFPNRPKGITKIIREKIEKEAQKKVRNGYRPKPEYYQVPPWIRKNNTYKKYFLECLDAEIGLRKGFACR